jgi:hypothetical protein
MVHGPFHSVAYWGWLEEGSFRWSALQLIQDGRYGRHLGFGFCRIEDKCLVDWSDFSVAYLRWLEELGSFRHVRWSAPPLIQDGCQAILDLVSIDLMTNAWVVWSDFMVALWGWLEEGSFRWPSPPLNQHGLSGSSFRWFSDQILGRLVRFFMALWGDWRKIPFYDQLHCSFKMAATSAILNLDSVDFLTYAWVDWSNFFCGLLGVTAGRFPSSIFTIFNLIFHTHRQLPTQEHMPRLA